MELFTSSHHGQRAYQFFQKEAAPRLQVRLGGTLPGYDLGSARDSLVQFINILTNDLAELTGAQVQLTGPHAELLAGIISRQNNLKF